MGKQIKIKVLKNNFYALEVHEIDDNINHRSIFQPNTDIDTLEKPVADLAKEFWTDEVKKDYEDFLQSQYEKLMKQSEIINE